MATPSQTSHRVRFGEFELDLSTRELWTNGSKQTLAPQPFQVLQLLIEHHGDLVTRDMLIRRLWPSDTFVDYEQGLKKAIARLRENLGDSAEEPRFIENLPRQGYRFIAEVHEKHSTRSTVKHIAVLPASRDLSDPVDRSRKWIRLAIAVGAVVVIALMVITWLRLKEPLPTVAESKALTNDGVAKYSLVTDGARLYYAEMVNGVFGISQISLSGGEKLWTKMPFADPNIYDISPDRSKLLVGGNSSRQLWVVPIPAGEPHVVGDVTTHGACWDPDGIHVIYAKDHDIYRVNQDGSETRKLASIGGYPGFPHFSPKGDRIRFNAFDAQAGTISIWEMLLNGREIHLLWPAQQEPLNRCCGLWSQTGKLFFFLVGQRFGDIWVADEKRLSGAARLTAGPLAYGAFAPSEDGKRLFAVGTLLRAELTRYDPETKIFAPFLGGISALDVDISRDGKWVTYVAFPDHTIWICKSDGSQCRQMTFPPIQGFMPRWSPDGNTIVFTDLRQARIYTVSREAGTPSPLLPEDKKNQIDPSWSPDGQAIIFARSHLDPDLAVYQLHLKTRTIQMIPGSKDLTGPRMSPDGRFIAALSRDWKSLMLYDTTIQQWETLATAGFGYATWSHDGAWLYARSSAHSVVRFKIADRHMEFVVDLKDFPEPGPSWMGLAPDDSILLHRDRSTSEIYSLTLENNR